MAEGLGAFQRLKLGVSALFGSADAKRTQEALARLDVEKRWQEFTFGPTASVSAEGEALSQLGGTRAEPARAAVSGLTADRDEVRERLGRGFASAGEGRAAEALIEADAIGSIKDRVAGRFGEIRSLVDEHRAEQREAWDRLAIDGPTARAGYLAQQMADLPEIPGLPRPDVSAFQRPYERATGLVPAEYQSGEKDGVLFDTREVGGEVDLAIAAAPKAEEALTRHLYDAARGYEAAIGKEKAARVLAQLRDPAAVRDLRAQRPELFDQQPAYASGMLGGGLMPMMLAMTLLSSAGGGWRPPASSGDGLGATQAEGWLGGMGVPYGPHLNEVLTASAAPPADDFDDDGDDGDGFDSDGGGDAGD